MKTDTLEMVRVDESEAKVIINTEFIISYEAKSDFRKEYETLIEKYRI